ncbi:MAG: tetratricopeptide repeat protein, partial [Dokdonella sp.]|uniref:tetratricopeptide repeat protein n=1 Tax=Dokdonella sp. TaxID=2291710 RepID=UPI003265073D
ARDLANKADSIAEKNLPATHAAAIDARVLLARQALEREDYAHSESILRDALARVHAAGDTDRASIDIMEQLAVIETKRDHREQALVLERDGLAERIRRDGPDAKSVAEGYANVGAGLTNLGRFNEAADAFERSAEIDRINRPPASYDVLSSLSNWGAALQAAGHITAALIKFREAEHGFAQLGGKPRRMRAVNLQKLCVTEVSFAAPATAAKTCAQFLQITRELAGESSTLMSLAVRTEASRLIEAGDLDGAALRLDESWQRLPDRPENQESRAVIRYVRASLAWLRGDAAATREDARWAIDHISGLAILWGARLSARTMLLLACADGPHAYCSVTPRKDLEETIASVANADDPRLLYARTALARQDIDRAPALAARAIGQAIDHARVELADDHPWIQAARFWRALALDHAGACKAAGDALPAVDTAKFVNPWLREAADAYARGRRC